ncbi:hypothetical protein PFLCHA0_c06320 [Pseudomonas protegens CHA0]|uniref:Uncharacterized protein n=2 Tax=Pseudomonas TaxID=286 RepID=A0A2C9EFK2_PSEPH|nr:hypothetical protein PFLCHA0_c06320 [Pseudomonas protegens CHA0]
MGIALASGCLGGISSCTAPSLVYENQRLGSRLHYCGYDVPLPDLSAPAPGAKAD